GGHDRAARLRRGVLRHGALRNFERRERGHPQGTVPNPNLTSSYPKPPRGQPCGEASGNEYGNEYGNESERSPMDAVDESMDFDAATHAATPAVESEQAADPEQVTEPASLALVKWVKKSEA